MEQQNTTKKFPIKLSAQQTILVNIILGVIYTILYIFGIKFHKVLYAIIVLALIESMRDMLFQTEKTDELSAKRQRLAMTVVVFGIMTVLIFCGIAGITITLTPEWCIGIGCGLPLIVVRLIELVIEIYQMIQIKKLEEEDDADA